MARRRNGKGPESSGGERTPAYARVSMCVRARATVHFLSKSVPANPVSNAGRHYRRLSGPGLMVPRLTASQPCTKQAARCRNREKRRRRRRRQVVPHTHTHTHNMVSRERKQMKEKFGDREGKKKQQVCLPGRHCFCSMCAGKAVTAGRSLAFFSLYFLLGSGEQFALLIQVCRGTSGPPSGTK